MHAQELDLFSGQQLRDTGIARVLDSHATWVDKAKALFDHLKVSMPLYVTGETVRLILLEAGLEAPVHPNAWGALTNSLVKMKRLQPTNRWEQAKYPTSHARMVRVYTVIRVVPQ